MKALNTLEYENASPEAQALFDSIKKTMGRIPNIYAAMANSPVALKAILVFGENLGKGEFTAKEREAIALAVGEQNKCYYCLSAHTVIANMAGFTKEETIELRKGGGSDNKLKALTVLAKAIVLSRGRPDDNLIADFFSAGYNKAALVELIGLVSLNTFTNYFNHIAETPVDFPEAAALSQEK